MAQTNETILQKAYDLLKHGILGLEQFPRKHKYTLADRLQNNLSDVLEALIEAYHVPANRKRTLLERANILLEQSRHYCRLCYELGLFNSIKYEDLARRLNEVGRMNGGWLKTIA
ncbi:MAG: diversity-generating retroelement protein Avd [Lewinellaceae bacterium]|nr:diversity-generating retroelement protein Avd [Lewinellaceae bacterium]